jgi:hypothetical protein
MGFTEFLVTPTILGGLQINSVVGTTCFGVLV